VQFQLSRIATVMGGVCGIRLARILVNQALEREMPGQLFSRLRVVGLSRVMMGMVIVAVGAGLSSLRLTI